MYGLFEALATNLAELEDYHGDVNEGLWEGLILSL